MMDIQQWKSAGDVKEIDGWKIFFVDSAPDDTIRPVILLLHGFPTSGWDWHWIWRDLSSEWRLIAPDLPGFGYSEKRHHHRYRIVRQAELMWSLLKNLDLGRFHILAHDYGDTVAQEMMSRDNGRPAAERSILSVCLLNGGLFPETHKARLIQKLLLSPVGPLVNRMTTRKTFDRSFSAVFGPHTRPTAEDLDSFWFLINENGGRYLLHKLITYMRDRRELRQRWVDALTDFSAPIQIINGSLDPVSGSHMVARYRELVGKGDIVELPDIGHYPQVEAPEKVASHYRSFLQSLSAEN